MKLTTSLIYWRPMLFKKSDLAYFKGQNSKKPIESPPQLISQYMDGRRRIPDGTPYPGKYSINRTPYAIEPLDNMSPFSGIKNTVVMKSVQSGFTTNLGENVLGFYIGARPAKIMYMSGTDALLKKFLNGRFDPLVDSCGFRPLIQSQSLKKNNRKTGDTAEYKEFPGGTASFGSLQSEASMRQESIMIMIRDEIGLIPMQMSSGEGNPLKVSDGRTVAFDESGRVKILDYSTPGTSGNCLVEMQYNKGDKRKFRVKCPICGKRQHLGMGDEKTNWGLKGDYKAGKLINAFYLCFHCHEAIFNHQKIEMLDSGIWEPTAISVSNDFRSYIFPAFYSPMLNWMTIRKEYDEAQETGDLGMKSFTNLYLAEAFTPSGEQPEMKSIIEIRSKYKSGQVPNDIMFLSCAGDVQPGGHKFKKFTNADIDEYVEFHSRKKDKDGIPIAWKKLRMLPRLEIEVMGHGMDRRTASIIYKKFYGNVDDFTSGAWAKLTNWITEKSEGLYFYREDGFKFPIEYMYIDSGYGKFTDVVYQYCDPFQKVYACKGVGTPKKDKLKLTDIDEIKAGNFMRYKLSIAGSYTIVLINTNYYKQWLYRNLKNISKGELQQLPNSHVTPIDYPDTYFEGLRAEKQKTDGSFHNPTNKANEPTDLWVYNMAVADFVIDNRILTKKEQWKKKFKKLRDGAKNKNPAAMEKLREIANRDVIMEEFMEELKVKGW